MKNLYIILFSFCATLVYSQSESAALIINKYQEATSINSLSSRLEYKNISKKGRVQKRTLEQFILKNDGCDNCYNFLLRFTAPSDVANTSALTIQKEGDDDQWLYLPVLRTSKRISASKKSDRFMGTEMSYEDLTNYLSEKEDENNYELLGSEAISGRSSYKISATTLSNSNSQYSKRVMWIDKETHLLVKSEFFDMSGELLKVFTASDIRSIGKGVFRAHSVKLENIQTRNTTEVSYQGFRVDDKIDSGIFTTSYLETL